MPDAATWKALCKKKNTIALYKSVACGDPKPVDVEFLNQLLPCSRLKCFLHELIKSDNNGENKQAEDQIIGAYFASNAAIHDNLV